MILKHNATMMRSTTTMLPSFSTLLLLPLLLWLVLVAASRTHAFTTSVVSAPCHCRTVSTTSKTRATCLSSSSRKVDLELHPHETAFVWIEYQCDFTAPGGKFHDAVQQVMKDTNMLDNSAQLADFARSRGCTNIHVPFPLPGGHQEIAKQPYGILAGVKGEEAFVAGEWGAGFSEKMTPKQGDLIAKGKSGLCGFATTNLDFLLRQRNTKNVVLGGFLTNCCVESTMRSAYELGYTVYTLKDCVAATSQEAQDATIQHNFGMFSVPIVSTEAMEAIELAISGSKSNEAAYSSY